MDFESPFSGIMGPSPFNTTGPALGSGNGAAGGAADLELSGKGSQSVGSPTGALLSSQHLQSQHDLRSSTNGSNGASAPLSTHQQQQPPTNGVGSIGEREPSTGGNSAPSVDTNTTTEDEDHPATHTARDLSGWVSSPSAPDAAPQQPPASAAVPQPTSTQQQQQQQQPPLQQQHLPLPTGSGADPLPSNSSVVSEDLMPTAREVEAAWATAQRAGTAAATNLQRVAQFNREAMVVEVQQETDMLRRRLNTAVQKLAEMEQVVSRFAHVKTPVLASDGFTYESDLIHKYVDECRSRGVRAVSQQNGHDLTDYFVANTSLLRLVESLRPLVEPVELSKQPAVPTGNTVTPPLPA